MTFSKLSNGGLIDLGSICAIPISDRETYLILDGTKKAIPIKQEDALTLGAHFQIWDGERYTIMPDAGLVVLQYINAILYVEADDSFGTEGGYALSLKGMESFIPLTEKDYQHLKNVLCPSLKELPG